ncbi:ferrichrome-iron receptor [Gloeobacter violaceus PCC 7421]|uniref:Ferrichrome-iron receptor n=1 Tax=Gloeobacter violaceus (strain ATCC 29082 / PCC 7421) TaxID=251221 RepID=Q7NJC3_GLOVI|nr:ferrichrome-iron receptor [Gloeobacter violaceus PCC 7421]
MRSALRAAQSVAAPVLGCACFFSTLLQVWGIPGALAAPEISPVRRLDLLAVGEAQQLLAQTQTPGGKSEDELEEVTVLGNRGYLRRNADSGTRTDTAIRDIPANIQVIPRQIIDDQGAVRIEEALRNVSGVTFASSFGGRAPEFNARGFTASLYKNGFLERNGGSFFNARTSPEVANLERLEVLKGPASVLFGQGDPGGTINLITKAPLLTPSASIRFTAGSYDFYRTTLDLGGPLTGDASLAYRLNIAYEDTHSFRDFVQKARFFVAPALTWKISPQTTLRFEGEYLSDNYPIDRGLVFVNGADVGLPVNRYLGDPTRRQVYDEKRGYLTLEHAFAENVRLRSFVRLSTSREDYRSTEVSGPLQADGRTLPLGGFEGGQYYETYTWQNDLIWKFDTGSIKHTLLVGFDWIKQTGFFYNNGFYDGNVIDIFTPVYRFDYTNRIDDSGFDGLTTANTFGAYIQDQIAFSDNLKLLLGGRFDSFDYQDDYRDDSFNSLARAQAFSPRVGLVWQPIAPVSLFATYNRSFLPQFGLNPSGTAFLPERGTLYEAGVKAELAEGRLFSTLSIYRLEKDNVLTADPFNPRFSIQVGQQSGSGVDFDIAGEILTGWNVIASWAYSDARITRDNTFAVNNRLPNAPFHTASLWTTYRLREGALSGFGVGAGLFYVGERAGDLDNTFAIPGYTRADAAVYYERERWRAAVNFKNLFNVRYFEGVQSDTRIYVGTPFTVQGTLSYQF